MNSDDYEQLYAEARDGAPFSNSDQGYGWMANNCDRCIHDKESRDDTGPGCPLVLVALMGKTPAQWLCQSDDDHIHAKFTCVEFRDENGGPGPEPQPIPDPPGQLGLVPRADYEGHRMLTPLTQPQEASAP